MIPSDLKLYSLSMEKQ